jgi:hypothetical protein
LKFQILKRYQIDVQRPIYEADATNTSEEIVADSFAEIPLTASVDVTSNSAVDEGAADQGIERCRRARTQLDNAMYDRRKSFRLRLQSAGSENALGLAAEACDWVPRKRLLDAATQRGFTTSKPCDCSLVV